MQLALDVPQRDVERRQRAGQRALRPELDAGVQQRVEQHGMVQRILADQRRREIVRDHAERGEAALHRRGLADAEHAVVGVDAHEGAVLRRLVVRRPAHLERIDAGDLHGACSLAQPSINTGTSEATSSRAMAMLNARSRTGECSSRPAPLPSSAHTSRQGMPTARNTTKMRASCTTSA